MFPSPWFIEMKNVVIPNQSIVTNRTIHSLSIQLTLGSDTRYIMIEPLNL